MKNKITLTMLLAVIALAMMSANTNSQNNFSGPRNMGAVLNSTDNDNDAALTPNGLSLYFTSTRPNGQGAQDIWVSHRATLNSAWDAPQNLGATVNTSAIERMSSFSLDGKTMFLQSTRTGGLGGRDIYISTRVDPNDDLGWTTPVNLGAPINTEFSEFHATYFEDQITGAASLIFARELAPVIPFHDLYESKRNIDGSFDAPVPIDELNSIGTELRTAIRRDGLEIFIGSSRPGVIGPIGSFDIFTSTRASISSPWSTPVLVPGINTSADENNPSLSPDGSILYLTSTRAGGIGQIDLYSVTRCSMYSDSPCGVNRTVSDFNGDGQTDISVFRPSDGTWWVMESGTNTVSVRQFGTSTDKIVPGDYDGDGRTDLAIFRPSEANWWILNSSNGALSVINWGLAADNLVPGDYDSDGKTDVAVYRDGTWYIHRSSDGQLATQQFGLGTDIPVNGVGVQ